jgi:hypothetical protein
MLKRLLSENKASILERWLNLVVETHPTEASSFLKEKDRFSNPVGYTISQEMNALYQELLQGGVNSKEVSESLENILKIRAIQGFSPQEAIAFVFFLRKAITEELGSKIEKEQIFGEWLNFESKIDELASVAFDIYMKCREKIYELRVSEAKAEKEWAFRLLELMGRADRKHGEVIE